MSIQTRENVITPSMDSGSKDFKHNGGRFLTQGEFLYFFSQKFFLGLRIDFKYLPLKVEAFSLRVPYMFYTYLGGPRVEDTIDANISSRQYNAGARFRP